MPDNFTAPADDRTCAYPGDQEHDHTMCEDALADRPQNCATVAAHQPHGTCAGIKLNDHPTGGLSISGLPPRALAIAAIHAFADHLAAHPELTMPHTVTAYATVRDVRPGETVTEAAERWADTHGVDRSAIFHGEHTVMITMPIATTETHGIQVVYQGHIHRDSADRPL